MKSLMLRAAAAAGLLAGAGQAAGAVATFFAQDLDPGGTIAGMPNSVAKRAQFLAGLTNVGTEGFDTFTPGTSPPLGLVFSGAGTATLNGNAVVANTPGSGRFATSGGQFLETGKGGGFHITFDNPGGVAAFGFYGTDLGDFGNLLSLRFTRLDNSTYDVLILHSLFHHGAGMFFGIITDEGDVFKKVTFRNGPLGLDVFGFDDMTVGSIDQVIPLPPALYTSLGVMAAAAGIRTIRRRG